MKYQVVGRAADGSEMLLPMTFDSATHRWGINLPGLRDPVCTIEIGNTHPFVSDVRLAVGNDRNDGSRGVVTISGPYEHASLAFGGPSTGIIGSNFGIGSRGTYPFILTPGVPYNGNGSPFFSGMSHISHLFNNGGINKMP